MIVESRGLDAGFFTVLIVENRVLNPFCSAHRRYMRISISAQS